MRVLHLSKSYAECPDTVMLVTQNVQHGKLALPDAVSKVWPLLMDAVQNTPTGTVAEACGVWFMISLVCLLSQQS